MDVTSSDINNSRQVSANQLENAQNDNLPAKKGCCQRMRSNEWLATAYQQKINLRFRYKLMPNEALLASDI